MLSAVLANMKACGLLQAHIGSVVLQTYMSFVHAIRGDKTAIHIARHAKQYVILFRTKFHLSVHLSVVAADAQVHFRQDRP